MVFDGVTIGAVNAEFFCCWGGFSGILGGCYGYLGLVRAGFYFLGAISRKLLWD